jgi:hypothetical protein
MRAPVQRDYLNAPVDTWLAIYNASYTSAVTPEDRTDTVPGIRSNVFAQSLVLTRIMDYWGRTGGVSIVLPYAFLDTSAGPFRTSANGASDIGFLWQMNIFGGPALTLSEFQSFIPQTFSSFHLLVTTPLGAYNPTSAINPSANRWMVSPTVNLSAAKQASMDSARTTWRTRSGSASAWLAPMALRRPWPQLRTRGRQTRGRTRFADRALHLQAIVVKRADRTRRRSGAQVRVGRRAVWGRTDAFAFVSRMATSGAVDAFSGRPLSSASRPFTGQILNGGEGSETGRTDWVLALLRRCGPEHLRSPAKPHLGSRCPGQACRPKPK